MTSLTLTLRRLPELQGAPPEALLAYARAAVARSLQRRHPPPPFALLLDATGTTRTLDLSPLARFPARPRLSSSLTALEQALADLAPSFLLLVLPAFHRRPAAPSAVIVASDGVARSVDAYGLRGHAVVQRRPPPLPPEALERFDRLLRRPSLRA